MTIAGKYTFLLSAKCQIVVKTVKEDIPVFVNWRALANSIKKGICAYKHITLTNNDKIEDLEKQLNHLRDQIIDLTEQNKQKLKLIEKITAEKSEIINK